MKGIGDLWDRQDEQTADHDFGLYDSKPWMLLKVVLGIATLTLIYVLYALQELPWTIFGSVLGLLLMGSVPFLVGLIIGFSFDSMKWALALGIVVGMVSLALFFIIFTLPDTMGLADYEPAFMLDVWFYLFISFLDMITFVPAGVALAAATNMYD